jgi:hypothetical protein
LRLLRFLGAMAWGAGVILNRWVHLLPFGVIAAGS